MAIPGFTQGYPPDGSSLGETKATIRDNLDGSFLVFSVDHQDQNETGAGSHAKVSLKNTTGTITPTLPPGIFGAGYETLYSQPAGSPPLGPTGDLFMSRGGGAGIRLTGPGVPTASQNGYTFLPGGILLQWGFVAVTSSSTVTVNFSPNFPNNCFNVQLTRTRASSNPGDTNSTWVITTPSTSSFQIKNNDGHSWGYYWLAIGN